MTAKTNFDSEQLEKLKVWFDINPTPSKEQVDHISAQIKGLSASVWMWFHRQRNRVKTNQDISPSKVKTSVKKGLRCSAPHIHIGKTGSLSKRLDFNGNAEDCLEQGKDAEGNRQDRVIAKKVHIRGILRRQETSQQSGGRIAGECLKQTVKEAERRQHARGKFSNGGEVNTVNKTELIKNLEQESIGGSINRTEKRADPQVCFGAEPAQSCSKRKEKVADSLKHNRVTSLPGYIKNREKEVDTQTRNTTKPPQRSIKKAVTEADSHKQLRGKPAPVSISRTVKEKEQRNVKPVQESINKILKEADSQKHVSNKPVKRCMNKTDKAAEPLVHNRLKSAQCCTNSVEKVSKKKKRSLSQSDDQRPLREDELTHRVKKNSVPKKIGSNGNIPVNHGVHERVNIPQEKQVKVPQEKRVKVAEEKRRIGVDSPSATNRVLEEGESKLKRQIKGHVSKRRVTEISDVSVHHRAAENNKSRRSRRVTDISSLSVHKKTIKHKLTKESQIKRLLSRKSNPSVNGVKSDNVGKETDVSHEKPQSQSEMPAKPNACRKGIFSALSLPQGETNTYLSDSSDAEDFQDDQNKRTHKLSIKKTKKAGTLGNGSSIPVISRKRQQGDLAERSNRKAAGNNLRRIPLKSLSEVQTKESPVSPVTCEVSSTSTSQSSVISSTVEEVRDSINHSCKGCPKSRDSQDSDFWQGQEKEFVEEVGKRTVPVISGDKIWDPHDNKFLFKRELSVNLLKINLSSLSDKREVTVSSKMNSTKRHKKKKGGSPLCTDDTTDVSVDFSSVAKSTERSIWSSFASPIETSNKVWSAIASSVETPRKDIPFIETSALIDKDLNKFWSSVASSAEMPCKEIPFIESPTSADGDSTPSSSQDCLESSEGQNQSNKESILDECSCEVSSSVDLEKTPTGLTEKVKETERNSSAVAKKNKGEVEKNTADVMDTTQDILKTPDELMETMEDIENTSDAVGENQEEPEKISADLEEIKEEVAELKEYMHEAEKTSANLVENLKEVDDTQTGSTETMTEANKVLVELKGSRGEFEKTASDLMETPGEVYKAPVEIIGKTEISERKKANETDKEPDSELQDLYENIDSPDYDISTPYIVIDEVGCSDTEEFSMESTHSASKSASPIPLNVVKCPKTGVVIDVDNCRDDDEVIMVSSSTAKQTGQEPPRNKPLKNRSVCNRKQVGQGEPAFASKPFACGPTNPTCMSLKAIKKKDSHEVIDLDLDYCSEDDEVILLSTLSPHASNPKDVSIKKTTELSDRESVKGSPKCFQNKAQIKSVSQETSIEKEIVTSPQETLSVGEKLSESKDVSRNTEIETSDPVDENLPSSISDADIEIDKSEASSSVQIVMQVGEYPKSEESHEDSAEAALPHETEVDTGKDHTYETTEMCLMRNVVSLCSQSVSEEDLVKSATFFVPPQLVQARENGITLEMSCDTIPTMSNAMDDNPKSPEKLQTAGCNDFTSSDELVIDMETCDQIESFLQEKDVFGETCASTSDAVHVVVKGDPMEESMGHSDSTSSDELIIDQEVFDEMESLLQEKDVSENTSASTTEDNVEYDNSFIASDEVDIIITCNRDTTRLNAGEDLQATEELVQSGQDFASSDKLLIDENAGDETQCPLQEKDASEQNVGCYDSASSDELVIDENACDETQCPLQEKDASQQSVGCYDSASSDELVIDESACDETQCPLQEKDASQQSVRCYDSASSDELVIDENACDETQGPLQERDVSEDTCASQSDAIVAKIDPSHQNSGPENTISKELCIDVTTCEQVKCALPENNASGNDNTSSPSDAFDRKSDTAEQNMSSEDSTLGVSSCVQIGLSLQVDAVTEKDVSTSPSPSIIEKMDPAEQNEAYEDSMTSDEGHIDMTTHDEMECPPKANALLEYKCSIHASLGSSITLKEKVLASDVNTSKADAGVQDQGSLEEGILTSSDNSPLDKESPGIESEDVTETELPVSATDSTPSCDVALPHEIEAHVDKKGSPPTDAENTCMELSKDLDAEDVTGVTRGSAGAFNTSDCDMNTTAAPVQSQPNADAAVKSSLKNSSPRASGAPSVELQGISSEAFDPISIQKEKPSAVQGADVQDASFPNKEIIDAANIPVESTHVFSSETNGVSSGLIAITPSVAAEDLQAQSSLSTESASRQLPDTIIKSEPDVAAKEDSQSGTNTPGGDPSPSKLDNSTEKVKRPRSLNELVSDLTHRVHLGVLSKAATPVTTTSSVDLPYSTVGINCNTRYSAKSASSSTEPALQPPKPTPQPRRGSKRRVITNKNLKRPPLAEEVQLRIQQLNPYPCDNTWMRNAAVVELAQREVQLHCQPGETGSTRDHALGANLESSILGEPGTPTGGLIFCYQPGIGPTNEDSRGATDRDPHSAIAASKRGHSSNSRGEVQPSSNSTYFGSSNSVNATNSGLSPIDNSSNSRHSMSVDSTNSGHPTFVENNPLIIQLLKSTETKRSRTQSGDSKTKKRTRRRRKSNDDIGLEIASRANAFANGSFSEKDIRKEWMELLKVMEESTLSGSEEQPPSSETVFPASSTTASASEGDPSTSTAVPAEGLPPAAPDNQEASLGVSKTSSSTAVVSEVDDLSDMPSILRVFSLRDEEGGGQESNVNLGQSGLGSFNLDSARIVEEPNTPAQVYPLAAAALTSAARHLHDTTNLASSLPSYQLPLSMNRKRHSSQTYSSTDGVPPSKSAASVVNGTTFQEIPSTPLQQRQTNTNSSFPQQVSSSRLNHRGHSSGALRQIAPRNTFVINTPLIRPSSLNAQVVTGTTSATGVLASPPVLASQPVVQVVSLQPGTQQQVQPSLLGNGNLPSLLNPLILNQQIQRHRLGVSPPLCTPYPTSSISANVISGKSQVNLNTLSGQPAPFGNVVGSGIGYLAAISQGVQLPPPVNTQWTQPTMNLQLAPVTSQTYNNGPDRQATTLFYTQQAPTITFLPQGGLQ